MCVRGRLVVWSCPHAGGYRRTDEGWKFSNIRVEILWFAGLPMPRDLPLEPSA